MEVPRHPREEGEFYIVLDPDVYEDLLRMIHSESVALVNYLREIRKIAPYPSFGNLTRPWMYEFAPIAVGDSSIPTRPILDAPSTTSDEGAAEAP